MTTTFHWVRHGPTHAKSFVGWRDVPADLSDTAQLERLQNLLPTTAILVSSDLSRCSATADTLHGTRIADDRRLREFNFGDWDGVAFDDITARDPDLSRAYWETPGDVAPPNGESWNQSAARINRAVDALRQNYKGNEIIVVAHFGTILTQVARAMGISPHQAMKCKIDNLSVTTLVDYGDPWGVGRINHVP